MCLNESLIETNWHGMRQAHCWIQSLRNFIPSSSKNNLNNGSGKGITYVTDGPWLTWKRNKWQTTIINVNQIQASGWLIHSIRMGMEVCYSPLLTMETSSNSRTDNLEMCLIRSRVLRFYMIGHGWTIILKHRNDSLRNSCWKVLRIVCIRMCASLVTGLRRNT